MCNLFVSLAYNQTNKTIKIMYSTVTLNMYDELNEKQVTRDIDALNAFSSGSVCWELKGENEQRARLENWISERGNEQHDTILTLVSWTLNKY